MKAVKLYDIFPTMLVNFENLSIGWCSFTNVYVKKGDILYTIEHKDYFGKIIFSDLYCAPCDGFYVHNKYWKEYAMQYNWGYDYEPLLCEFWDSEEEFKEKSILHNQQTITLASNSSESEKMINPNQRIFASPITAQYDVETCYTYLMRDNSTGCYKIGISKKPEYRERTLQSEKPSIEMLCAKPYPNKKLAHAIEQALHKVYADKRVRGEWFRLDVTDIKQIRQMLEK